MNMSDLGSTTTCSPPNREQTPLAAQHGSGTAPSQA